MKKALPIAVAALALLAASLFFVLREPATQTADALPVAVQNDDARRERLRAMWGNALTLQTVPEDSALRESGVFDDPKTAAEVLSLSITLHKDAAWYIEESHGPKAACEEFIAAIDRAEKVGVPLTEQEIRLFVKRVVE